MPPSLTPRLILASGSAYRKELLSRLQLPFDVISPDIDETPLENENPAETALPNQRLGHREEKRSVRNSTSTD